MEAKNFSIGEVISFGWSKVKEKFWFWGSISFIFMLLNGISSDVTKKLDNNSGSAIIVSIIFTIIGMILQIGVIKLALNSIDNKTLEYSELYSNGKYFWKYLGASLLVGLITLLGFLLLIVPGIYWAIKYQFTTYLIIDQNLSITEAMKKSGELTHGIKLELFLLGLTFIGVVILGAIALLIGLLWAIPVTWLATAYIYKKLLGAINKKTSTPETANQTA